jgi:uncharacterized membrane protein
VVDKGVNGREELAEEASPFVTIFKNVPLREKEALAFLSGHPSILAEVWSVYLLSKGKWQEYF